MILHDAATAWLDLMTAALWWARAAGAALAFTLCVIAFAVGPLLAPGAPVTRRAVHPASPATAAVRRRPVPSWAHTDHHREAA